MAGKAWRQGHDVVDDLLFIVREQGEMMLLLFPPLSFSLGYPAYDLVTLTCRVGLPSAATLWWKGLHSRKCLLSGSNSSQIDNQD